jgi:hypothetical protein
LRDGKDGRDGIDGKDADVGPLFEMYKQVEAEAVNRLASLEEHLQQKVHDRLVSLTDGKDGEPGRDGKDADIEPLRQELIATFDEVKSNAERQVKDVLATLKDGKDGKDGEPGKDGEQGPPGEDGKDGKMPLSRLWTDAVHYEGDVVRHNGAMYQALTNTGREPPHSDWGELAGRGADGIGFVLRGTYDATAEYRQHDIVMLNRNSFAAKYDSPGDCPGDGWQLFRSKRTARQRRPAR